MANEITVTGSLSGYKAGSMGSSIARSFTNLLFNMAGTTYVEGTMSVATSDTLIPLGGVTAPHWAFFRNLDAVNFVKLKTASGGAYFAKLLAGEVGIFPLLDTNTAIMGIADTAAVRMEYLIFNL